jgi:hypothetical protein
VDACRSGVDVHASTLVSRGCCSMAGGSACVGAACRPVIDVARCADQHFDGGCSELVVVVTQLRCD